MIFVPLSQSLHPIHNQNRNSLHDSNLIPIQVYSERKYEAKIKLLLVHMYTSLMLANVSCITSILYSSAFDHAYCYIFFINVEPHLRIA